MGNTFRFLLLSASAVLLGACGGGGSGASAPSTLTISGAVVKGPMAMAQVKAYKTTSAGAQGELLGSAITDTNGGYTMSTGSYTGAVLLTSTATSDTTMWDEATGASIKPPVGYSLRASLAATGSGALIAQVNPFTEMATAAAVKAGGLTMTNVASANADMAAVLTFNPLDAVPQFDATSHAAKNAAAAALTAVSNMALSGALNCGAGDQAAKVSCTTAAMASSGMGDAALKSALQTHITSVTSNLGLPTLTLQNPSGKGVSDATPLDQTKAFFTALRSNAKALSGTEFSLKSELEAANSDLKNRTVPVAESNLWLVWMAADAAQLWKDSVVDTTKLFVSGKDFYKNSFNANGYFDVTQAFGGCEITSDEAGTMRATSREKAKYMSCSTYAYRNVFAAGGINSFVEPRDANGYVTTCTKPGDICGTHWDTVLTMRPTTSTSTFSVVTATRKRVLTLAASALPLGCNDRYLDPMWSCPAGTFSYVDTFYGAAASPSSKGNQATLVTSSDSTGAITGAELTGELAPAFLVKTSPDFYYEWTPSGIKVKQDKTVTVLGEKQNIRLKAALTTVNSVSKLALTAYMDVVVNGAVDSHIELLDGSYLQARANAPGVYTGREGSEAVVLKLRGGTLDTMLDGTFSASNPLWDASHTSYQPNLVGFSGKFSRKNIALFTGTLTEQTLNYGGFDASKPTSVTNQRKNKLDFNGSLSIPNRPNLGLTMSMVQTLSSPVCNGGTCTSATYSLAGQYQQGLLTINFEGAGSELADTITLTSTSEVKLVADTSAAVYPITKNGQTMGVYDPKKMQVNYTDGTYEQF